MNSIFKKPGPKGVRIDDLLSWEHEWYWIFHGLAYGIPNRIDMRTYWQGVPPPKPTSPELYAERVKTWNKKRASRDGWKRMEQYVESPGVAPEKGIWQQIESASSASAIVRASDRSAFWLNARANGRPYTVKLKENAHEFLKAKEYRYPTSDRPSSEEKRVLHFARAMAGIMEGIGSVRAIDLIRLQKHGRACSCVQCDFAKLTQMREALARAGVRGFAF